MVDHHCAGAIARENPLVSVEVSAASWWELIVKRARGRLSFPDPERFLPEMTRTLGVRHVLGVEASHVLEVERLPVLHRDPFDRILIAQARVERAILITADTDVRAYPVDTFWE